MFWDATTHGWTVAADLHSGDQLASPGNGHTTVVSLVRHGGIIRTYNLTVDTVHTFYVEAGSTAVLVHNCNLADHEGVNGGRTIEKHVGKDDSYLIGRTTGRRGQENASSFTDLHAAEIETQANDPTHAVVYNRTNGDWRPGRTVVTSSGGIRGCRTATPSSLRSRSRRIAPRVRCPFGPLRRWRLHAGARPLAARGSSRPARPAV